MQPLQISSSAVSIWVRYPEFGVVRIDSFSDNAMLRSRMATVSVSTFSRRAPHDEFVSSFVFETMPAVKYRNCKAAAATDKVDMGSSTMAL
jgi:hypothetical protein